MVNISDIRSYINEIYPENLAFDRDNVGFLVGRSEKEVKSVLISLDVDESVATEAAELGVDLIVSHHPLMFHPVRTMTDSTPSERTLRILVKNDIGLISAHTNLDCVCGGLNDYLCKKLGIVNTKVIDVVGETDGHVHGFGRIGELFEEITLSDMLQRCKDTLDANGLRYTGDENKKIKSVAVNCGGGADLLNECIRLGADLFITGDVKYNPFRDAFESDMALIDAGHYETEHIVVELLGDVLSKQYSNLKIHISNKNIAPIKFYYK